MHRFRYTIHNMIGHPIMEVFSILGLNKWASWVHDVTLPNGWEDEDSEENESKWKAGEK